MSDRRYRDGALEVLSDDDLLALVAKRNHPAFQALARRLSRQGLGLAGQLLRGDTGDVEDVVQEALLRVWRRAPDWRFDGDAKISTWFYRVVYNLCIDRLRRAPHDDVAALPDLPSEGEPAPALLAREQEARLIRDAVAALPDRQREAVVLCYFQDCSRVEAAEVMGSTPDAVESLLARARRSLRVRIQGLSGDAA